MIASFIQPLLIVQEIDHKRVDLESRLRNIPLEISRTEKRIEHEKAEMEASRSAVKELEVNRKELENELAAAEARVVKYRNQQLQVKKNEEYQALTHEIENVQKNISAIEEKEIQVLYDLDTERDRADKLANEFNENIRLHEQRIAKLREQEEQARNELENVRSSLESAREAVPTEALRDYDRVSAHVKLPVVVPIRERRCQGCFLKVSSGVENDARQGSKITTCGNCNRIVFWEG